MDTVKTMNEIHERFLELLKTHILLNNYETQYGNISKPAISKYHAFYANLVITLSELFEIPQNILSDMSYYTYLYFKGMRELDSLLDDPRFIGSLKLLNYRYSDVFISESIAGFAKIFPTSNGFWGMYSTLKKEYYDGMFLWNALQNHEVQYSSLLYRELARKQNIFVLIPISALCAYSNDFQYYAAIKESLLELHLGIQATDDVQDFKEDYRNGLQTYPQHLLMNYLLTEGIDSSGLTEQELYYHFFKSRIALNHLMLAQSMMNNSLEIVSQLPLHSYRNELLKLLDDLKATIAYVRSAIDHE